MIKTRLLSIKQREQGLIEHSLFMKAEINAIDTSKYIESQKAHRDLFFDDHGQPSQDFFLWWIQMHGEKFRGAWKESVCRKCQQVIQCKNCLKSECTNFLQNPDMESSFYRDLKLFFYRIIFKLDKLMHPRTYSSKRRK